MIPTPTARAGKAPTPTPSSRQPMTPPTTRTRRAPTQERGRRTVQKILDATERIIAEHGIDAANTRAIAERAGVVVPSLYHFFADRDEILDALVQHMVTDLDQQAEAAEAAWKPGEQDLIGIGSTFTPTTSRPAPSRARCGSADAHPRRYCNRSTIEATNSPPASARG